MRADRLVATTLYLQRRGRVTAAELAGHLEVSIATARRDLEALGAAGVPVYPQPGRGGGWQLVGGARTDLTGLTEPEVRALFAALGSTDVPAQAASALAKLVRAMPEPFRDLADVAVSAHRVEGHAWEAAAPAVPAALAPLRDAILRRRGVSIRYRRRGATEPTDVAVDPWRLVEKAGVSYLLAGSDRGPRTYRVDRIEGLVVDEQRVVGRPDDAVLDAQWRRSVESVDAARTAVTARIRTDSAAMAVLGELFGTALRVTDAGDEAVVAAHTARGLAEKLAGWGSRVVVLDAPAVAAELLTIGQELIAQYRDPQTRT
jgi:predicted DNA-binding transcriptional regulator YafY